VEVARCSRCLYCIVFPVRI